MEAYGPRIVKAVIMGLTIGVGVLLPWGAVSKETKASTLESLRSSYREKRAVIIKPMDDLKAKYEAKLVEMEAAAKAKGELELALLNRTEREGFAKENHVEVRAGELHRQQSIYRRESARLMKLQQGRLELLQGKYVTALQKMMGRYTKSREIEKAVAVQNELKPIKAEIDRRAAAATAARAPLRDLVKLKPVKADGSKWFHKHYKSSDPITIDGTKYRRSERIYAHAPSTITWEFDPPVTQFKSTIAVMLPSQPSMGNVIFRVLSGETVLHESPPVYNGSTAEIDIRFKPTKTLTLVTDPGEVEHADHSFWIKPTAK